MSWPVTRTMMAALSDAAGWASWVAMRCWTVVKGRPCEEVEKNGE